jgi:23S rRNA G2445 N2-methylase RlmL
MTPEQQNSYGFHARCVENIHDDLVKANSSLVAIISNLPFGEALSHEATRELRSTLTDVLMKLSGAQGEASYVKRSMGSN